MLLMKSSENHGEWEGLRSNDIEDKLWPLKLQSCFWNVWMKIKSQWLASCSLEEISKSHVVGPCLIGSMTLNLQVPGCLQNQCWNWWFESFWRGWRSLWTQKTQNLWDSRVLVYVVSFDLQNVSRRVWEKRGKTFQNIIENRSQWKMFFVQLLKNIV